MTDDERAAREWVQGQANLYRDFVPGSIGGGYFKAATTILRLLDRPVCPRGAEVPNDVLGRMHIAYHDVAFNKHQSMIDGMRAAIDTLHAHLTAPPKPAKVEAWAVMFPGNEVATYPDETSARICAGSTGRVIKLVEADDADR